MATDSVNIQECWGENYRGITCSLCPTVPWAWAQQSHSDIQKSTKATVWLPSHSLQAKNENYAGINTESHWNKKKFNETNLLGTMTLAYREVEITMNRNVFYFLLVHLSPPLPQTLVLQTRVRKVFQEHRSSLQNVIKSLKQTKQPFF
jgi:hypothetical protein